jgi:hypothetical protein
MRSAKILFEYCLELFSPEAKEAAAIALERARLICELAARGIQPRTREEVAGAFARVGDIARAADIDSRISADLLRKARTESAACQERLQAR